MTNRGHYRRGYQEARDIIRAYGYDHGIAGILDAIHASEVWPRDTIRGATDAALLAVTGETA